jgi:hypothetical protein
MEITETTNVVVIGTRNSLRFHLADYPSERTRCGRVFTDYAFMVPGGVPEDVQCGRCWG